MYLPMSCKEWFDCFYNPVGIFYVLLTCCSISYHISGPPISSKDKSTSGWGFSLLGLSAYSYQFIAHFQMSLIYWVVLYHAYTHYVACHFGFPPTELFYLSYVIAIMEYLY